jgi:DNA-binding CsgD family transcriptional regulator
MRLFGAADAWRRQSGIARFRVHQPSYDAARQELHVAFDGDLERAWQEGAALSVDEAIAYAQRGRGERRRPSNGWAALTPTERDVVRLVGEGLSNKDIGARLFISPRTVQSHLTHVYTKLGLRSRVQLAREVARRT